DVNKQRAIEILSDLEAFNPKKKTLCVAEGFFDYLSLVSSEQILEDIKSLNSVNNLLTTFFSLHELNLFHRYVFTTGVSLVGEILKFKLIKNEFVQFLEKLDFSLDEQLSHQEMQHDLVKNAEMKLPVLKGFYVMRFSIRS